MSVSPKEFVERFRVECPDERLTYQAILDGTGREDLKYANLQNTNLQGADLQDANLWGAILPHANMWSANLRNANLRRADLRGANLWGADLLYANLRGVKLQGANLRGVNLQRSTIFQLRGLPSGEVILYPTPDGWVLRVGCWKGTLKELKTLITEGEWPRVGNEEEIVTQRALFESVYPLLEHHIARNSDVIEELAQKWNTKNKGEIK